MCLARKNKKGYDVTKKIKAEKTEKKSKGKTAKAEKKSFLSDRQKKVLLVVLFAMLILVPMVNTFRCKAACLKRVKTPYPEVACKYECPWFWEKR